MATRKGKLIVTFNFAQLTAGLERFADAAERAARALREAFEAEHESTWWRGGEPFDDDAWQNGTEPAAVDDGTELECWAEGDTVLEE